MNCPKCNHIVKDTAKFCENCGAKIEVDNTTIECPSCHARIPKDSKFCPDCGKSIRKALVPPPTRSDIYVSKYYQPFVDGKLLGYKDLKSGDVVIEPQFKLAYKFNDGLALAYTIDNHFVFIDKYGEEVLNNVGVPRHFRNGISVITNGVRRYAIINRKGDYIVPYGTYDDIGVFYEGIAVVRKNDKYGLINTQGNIVVPCNYYGIDIFSNGLAKAHERSYHDQCYIDSTGKVAFRIDSNFYGGRFSDGLTTYARRGTKTYGYIDKKGRQVIPCKYSTAHEFSEGLALVEYEWNRYGYINTQGQVIIKAERNDGNFKNGMAVVRRNNKCGFMNKRGELVIPCIYDSVSGFSDGLARVEINRKSGFVNVIGELVIPCTLDYVEYEFKEGIAKTHEGCVDIFGNCSGR